MLGNLLRRHGEYLLYRRLIMRFFVRGGLYYACSFKLEYIRL